MQCGCQAQWPSRLYQHPANQHHVVLESVARAATASHRAAVLPSVKHLQLCLCPFCVVDLLSMGQLQGGRLAGWPRRHHEHSADQQASRLGPLCCAPLALHKTGIAQDRHAQHPARPTLCACVCVLCLCSGSPPQQSGSRGPDRVAVIISALQKHIRLWRGSCAVRCTLFMMKVSGSARGSRLVEVQAGLICLIQACWAGDGEPA